MRNSTNQPTETKIAPYTPKELAALYGVTRKTLQTWLKPHETLLGKRISLYFTAKQVRVIFEVLGEPG